MHLSMKSYYFKIQEHPFWALPYYLFLPKSGPLILFFLFSKMVFNCLPVLLKLLILDKSIDLTLWEEFRLFCSIDTEILKLLLIDWSLFSSFLIFFSYLLILVFKPGLSSPELIFILLLLKLDLFFFLRLLLQLFSSFGIFKDDKSFSLLVL